MNQYMPLIALILAGIALLLSIVIPIIHSHNNNHWNENEIRDKVVRAVKESTRVEHIVSEKVQNKLAKVEQPKSEIPIDEIIAEVTKRLMPEIQKMAKAEMMQEPKSSDKPNMERFGYYGKEAFVLTETQNDNSVFRFVLDPNNEQKARFDILDNQKVVQDRNFLQGCCSSEGDGNNVETLKEGVAVFKDGKWILEQKLRIKFS